MMHEDGTAIEKTRAEWTKDKGLWTLLVGVGMLSPFTWNLTDLFSPGFYPLYLILAIYLGYRMGRWYGALGGLAMVAPWVYWSPSEVIRVLNDADLLEDLLSAQDLSFQQMIIAGLLGWLSGFLSDVVEDLINRNSHLYIAVYFPRRRGAWVERGGKKLATLFQNWSKKEDANDSQDEKKYTLDSFVTNLRSLATRVNQLAIVPAVLSVLNLYVVVLLLELDDVFLDLNLIPAGLSALLIVTLGYITASYIAVLIALLVWVGSWVGSLSELPIYELIEEFADDYQFDIDHFSAAIGVAILTWIAVRVSRLQRREGLTDPLLHMLKPYRRPVNTVPAASLSTLLPVFLLFFVVSVAIPLPTGSGQDEATESAFYTEERLGDANANERAVLERRLKEADEKRSISIELVPWTMIFFYLVYLGAISDARGVSNRFISLFAVFLFFQLTVYFSDTLYFTSYRPGVFDFLLLALAPFAGRYLDLRQLKVCRATLAGGWLLSLFLSIYVYGSIDAAMISIHGADLLSLAAQAILIELLARLLHGLEVSGGVWTLLGRLARFRASKT